MNTVKIFAVGVTEQVKNYLPEEFQNVQLSVVENVKNNGVIMTGINVHVPGENISPVIYMNEFYEEIKKGASLEDTMENIAECMEQCRRDAKMNREIGMDDFDLLKDRVTPMLVNAKANREMLQNMPYVQVEDLAMIFKVDMAISGREGHGTMKVNNQLLERWGMTKEELYKSALSNMPEYDSPVLTPMSDMIFELSFGGKTDNNLLAADGIRSISPDEMMFVLTNEMRYHGASALLCPGVMDKISEMMPNGFYVLPSSIHEILIVPKECGMSPKDLGQMVREVNRDMVSREEILSDRVYEYNKELGKIQQVPESIQKSREAIR